jgi:hypothetical protein
MFRRRTGCLIVAICITALLTPHYDLVVVNGFTSAPLHQCCNFWSSKSWTTRKSTVPLRMETTQDPFFDDFYHHGGDDSSRSSYFSSHYPSRHVQQYHSNNNNKFVTGDELHRLRHQVLSLRLELQEARRNLSHCSTVETADNVEYRYTRQYHQQRVHELEQAIMKTQQVDAEFVYAVSLERQELAEQAGNVLEASRYHQMAMEARAALPQFNLEGLWVGKYSEDGYEMINITYHGDILLAEKVTGTKNVPKGQSTFQVDLSPEGGGVSMLGTSQASFRDSQQPLFLSPIELGDAAAKQWGCRYLPRFSGWGQVAAEGYRDSQWIDGQLIMVNEYFSFAWLPIGHQVFFGRPTPELILKLMKDEQKKDVGGSSARAFLEKCWEETEHMEDDLEINSDSSIFDSSSSQGSYDGEGCFQ